MRIGLVFLLAAAALLGISSAFAADNTVVRAPAGAAVVAAEPPPGGVAVDESVVKVKRPGPPEVAYGCKRVWRCDAQVCEWRRGCYGVYGYVEAPYYSKPLAQRQWEQQGLPGPGTDATGTRRRAYVEPNLK
jgi:hypothetical protein